MVAQSSWFQAEFLRLKYWPTWVGIGIMRILAVLPYRVQLWLGKLFGRLFYWLAPTRKRIARINIGLCFPDKTPAEQQQLLQDCFTSIGQGAMEVALAWWGSQNKVNKLCHLENFHYIEEALSRQQNVLLLTAHMTSIEMGGRLLSQQFDLLQGMYKPSKNKLFNAIMLKRRQKFCPMMIPRKNPQQMIRNLRKGYVTWYAPDQNFGREDYVFAPFFNVPTLTITATSRIAAVGRAVVIPYFPQRLPDNQGYKLCFYPPLENFPSADDLRDATLVNQAIETAVIRAPEQYLWLHRRFRHCPDGQQRQY